MKHQIYNYLKAAPGPVKRPELLRAVRVNANDLQISDRAMRKAIEEMIVHDGYMIASSEQGYHIIETENQLLDAMEYLVNKAESISIRKNTLLKNWNSKHKTEPKLQPSLF